MLASYIFAANMTSTINQFDIITERCSSTFRKKNTDYGMSWRILRPQSLTDQLLIKARRIRSIEEKGEQKIDDSINQDYEGLVNYSVMALIQLAIETSDDSDEQVEVFKQYDQWIGKAKSLMENKNHDYGEVWRDMRLSSITDLILMKLLRIKQIEDNNGRTVISEGLEANYLDIINYSIFALIRISEGNKDMMYDA